MVQIRDVAARAQEVKRAYAGDEERPLGSYLGLIAAYATTGAAAAALALRHGKRRDARIAASDLALLSVATFKLSRVISRDSITSPLRAPFVRYEGSASSPAEVHEDVQGSGVRKALGELLTCPFCLGQWIGTGFVVSFVLSPRFTRFAATTLTVSTVSDVLQLAYTAANKVNE